MPPKRTSEALQDAQSVILNASQQPQPRPVKKQRVEHADRPNHLRDTMARDASSKVARVDRARTPSSSQRVKTGVIVRNDIVTKPTSARSTSCPRPSSSRLVQSRAPVKKVPGRQVVNPAHKRPIKETSSTFRRKDHPLHPAKGKSRPWDVSTTASVYKAPISMSAKALISSPRAQSPSEQPSTGTPATEPRPRVKVPEVDPVEFKARMEAIGMGWYKLPLTRAQMPKFRKKSETGGV